MSRRTEVCREFLRGSCRFGSRCKFLHDTSQQQRNQLSSPFSFGVKNQGQPQLTTSTRGGNYYTPLTSPQRQQQKGPSQVLVKEHRCTDPKDCSLQINEDFENEQPSWRLTCYAHGKYLPNDIVGDISFEELRAQAYTGALQGLSLENMVQIERNMIVAKKREFDQLAKNPYSGPASSSSSAFDLPAFSTATPDPARMSFGTATHSYPSSPFGPAPPQVSSQSRGLFGSANVREHAGFSFGLGAAPQKENTTVSPLSLFPSQSTPAPGFSFGMQSFAPGPSLPASSPQSGFGSSTSLPGFGQETNQVNHNAAHSTAQSLFGSNKPAHTVNMREALNNIQSDQASGLTNCMEAPMNELATELSSQIMSSLPSLSTGQSDIWLKELWTLGEIPEEEPPIYAR